MEMVEIARQLNRPDTGAQLILLCGRHEEARREISSMPRHIPMFIEGFTCEVPLYMERADFFIGKPGPGSISEAIVKRLPIIVRRDRRTLAHEEYNCQCIVDQGVGIVVSSYDAVFDAVQDLFEAEGRECLRANLAAIRNEAVYEIPSMLDSILASETPSKIVTPTAVC
jgi:UDP-N-acetylglucosamine:LPS N-acetylglucosamine transferase